MFGFQERNASLVFFFLETKTSVKRFSILSFTYLPTYICRMSKKLGTNIFPIQYVYFKIKTLCICYQHYIAIFSYSWYWEWSTCQITSILSLKIVPLSNWSHHCTYATRSTDLFVQNHLPDKCHIRIPDKW